MEQVSLGTSSNMVTRTHIHHTSYWFVPCVRHLAAAAVLSYCLSVPAVANAATYYLNTSSGSDSNPGTSIAPGRLLPKCNPAPPAMTRSSSSRRMRPPTPPMAGPGSRTGRRLCSNSPLPGRSTPITPWASLPPGTSGSSAPSRSSGSIQPSAAGQRPDHERLDAQPACGLESAGLRQRHAQQPLRCQP